MQFNHQPWWRTDEYDNATPVPSSLAMPEIWGSNGPALVPLFSNGKTGPGWGLQGSDGRPGFIEKYRRLEFALRRVMYGVDRGQHDWAWIMRSGRVVCLDIDGKNGGLEHASELGFLPPTVAETSKSGNGYHLFYLSDDTWDSREGFARYADHIGIVTGVDFRGTGCVYHYPTQRWNTRSLAPLPDHLSEMLLKKQAARTYQKSVIHKTLELDEMEVLLMQQEILAELAKPIPVGKRNNTLFAIGTNMMEAKIEGWDEKLGDRAAQLGLDSDEIDKLIANIEKYGGR